MKSLLKRSVLIAQAAVCSLLIGCAFSPLTTHHPSPPGMVYIPAGNFLMGSTERDGVVGMEVGLDEMPQHPVYVKGFYIDLYEVTNDQYYEYVKVTGGYTPATWDYKQHPSGKVWPAKTPPPGEENHPVTDIDWYDAEAYCKWAGKRLPTEAEWEKAARGTDGWIWPWGNTFDSAKVNTLESGKNWSMPVGSYPQGVSPYEVYDMIGNVWEWTASWYKAYPGSSLKRAAFGEKYRVVRGGSFLTPVQPFARVTHRYAPDLLPMELRDSNWHTGFDVGFRCAKAP